MPLESQITETLNAGENPLSLLKKIVPIGDVGASQSFVVAVIIVVGIIFFTITPILFYHWKKYAVKIREDLAPKTIYLIVAAILWITLIGVGLKLIR